MPTGSTAVSTPPTTLPAEVEQALLGHFVHACELVSPWPSLPQSMPEPPLAHYWQLRCTLKQLLQPDFIDRHMCHGDLYALLPSALEVAALTFATSLR